jgi:hypothetical protein
MLGKHLARFDPVLALALGLALLFSFYGITWGRVECWNPDQMALRGLHGWFLPFSYQKPPLHTYLNERIIVRPIEAGELLVKFAFGKQINLNEARLLGSRLLVALMYLGTVYLAYLISRDVFGVFAARIIALLFATSAGFIAYEHFLTCDSPLLLFMVFVLFLAMRIYASGHLVNYLLTGFATGVCAAMKYNGLAVGVTIVVAHFLSKHRKGLVSLVFDRRLIAGLFMVPLGFVAANPGALFNFKKFAADYIYNSKVTPRYGGVMEGHGYFKFLERIPEIVGWPGAILIAVASVSSLIVIVMRRDFRNPGATCFALAASVFLLYFGIIGSFPRMESRFVLPAVPFLILMAGPFLQTIATKGRWIYPVLLPLLLYNSLCCLLVGKRFASDPRMGAQVWLQRHAGQGLVIESSPMSPHWAKLPRLKAVEILAANPIWERTKGFDVIDWRMPYAFGRLQLFKKVFHDDPWIQEHVAQYEIEADEWLYREEELLKRNPSLITVHSIDYSISNSAVRSYYANLLEGKFPYQVAFDRTAIEPPRWVYPRNIDFLSGRMTILKRRPGT